MMLYRNKNKIAKLLKLKKYRLKNGRFFLTVESAAVSITLLILWLSCC